MTAKEKADELIEKMTIDWDMCRGQNIKCAIICCDEILSEDTFTMLPIMIKYWQDVKKELESIV